MAPNPKPKPKPKPNPGSCHLQQALLVEQEVGRLEVAVDEVAGVAVQQRLQGLVHDELLVHRLEDVGADDGVQVRLHVVEDEVDVLRVEVRGRGEAGLRAKVRARVRRRRRLRCWCRWRQRQSRRANVPGRSRP